MIDGSNLGPNDLPQAREGEEGGEGKPKIG